MSESIQDKKMTSVSRNRYKGERKEQKQSTKKEMRETQNMTGRSFKNKFSNKIAEEMYAQYKDERFRDSIYNFSVPGKHNQIRTKFYESKKIKTPISKSMNQPDNVLSDDYDSPKPHPLPDSSELIDLKQKYQSTLFF